MFAYMHYQLNGDWAAMQTKMHCADTVGCLKQLWDDLVACTARAGPLLETYVAAIVRGRPYKHAFSLAVSCLSKHDRQKLLAATRPEDRPALQQVLSQASPAAADEYLPSERAGPQHAYRQQQQQQLPPRAPRASDAAAAAAGGGSYQLEATYHNSTGTPSMSVRKRVMGHVSHERSLQRRHSHPLAPHIPLY